MASRCSPTHLVASKQAGGRTVPARYYSYNSSTLLVCPSRSTAGSTDLARSAYRRRRQQQREEAAASPQACTGTLTRPGLGTFGTSMTAARQGCRRKLHWIDAS